MASAHLDFPFLTLPRNVLYSFQRRHTLICLENSLQKAFQGRSAGDKSSVLSCLEASLHRHFCRVSTGHVHLAWWSLPLRTSQAVPLFFFFTTCIASAKGQLPVSCSSGGESVFLSLLSRFCLWFSALCCDLPRCRFVCHFCLS